MMRKLIPAVLVILLLAGCGAGRQAESEIPKETAAAEAETAAEETNKDEAANTPAETQGSPQPSEEETAPMTMKLKIEETLVDVQWEDNDAAAALRALAEQEPLRLDLSMYGGFEQVGPIGQRLPRNDEQTTTSSGDIVLYAGDQIVLFYGSNSWAYTRLGHITDRDEAGMKALLGYGDVSITIFVE